MTRKNKEREFLLECIELYRDLPVLWQIKNKVYHDRKRKNMAYDILLTKYKVMFPQATKEDLKKKINSLRTNYRKELKKYEISLKSGAGTDSTYVPTLWYFEELNFLRDLELPLDSESSMDTQSITTADGDGDNKEKRSPSRTPSRTTNTHASKKARKNEQVTNLAYERLNEEKDENHHWAMTWTADLRKMERTQQIYAKKAIAEIIMEGQLGLLHRNSVKINETSPLNSAVQFGASPQSQYRNQCHHHLVHK